MDVQALKNASNVKENFVRNVNHKCPCWTGPMCRSCTPEYYNCRMSGCDVTYCCDCKNDIGDNSVEYCGDCRSHYCIQCRIAEYRIIEWHRSCNGCLKVIGPELAKENEYLRREIKDLNQKNTPSAETETHGHTIVDDDIIMMTCMQMVILMASCPVVES